MTEWNKTKDGAYAYARKFETFDHAWEFMGFLAKLARSTNVHPRITNQGCNVDIELYDKKALNTYGTGVIEYFTDKKSKTVDKISTDSSTFSIYSDGGSRGNPGPSASGFLILDPAGQVVAEGGEFLGVTTNNQAEYHSLRAGLDEALRLGINDILFHMDSLLVVNQINGKYKVKNKDLWPIYESIRVDIQKLQSFKLIHIPRELNREADQKVNDILDEHISK